LERQVSSTVGWFSASLIIGENLYNLWTILLRNLRPKFVCSMKKQPPPVRKEKRSTRKMPKRNIGTRNGAELDSNGRRDRRSSIRELRHPKTELESAIQRYVDLYDFAPIAYVSFDRAGRIEEANLAATELLSEPRDLLIGRPFAFYVADLDSLLRHLLYCRTSQQQVKTELLLKSKKGERIPALLLSTPITSTTRNGALLYQTAIIDLRERKAAEEALRAKEAELEQIVTQTPFMLTRCSHDLRYRYVSHAYAKMLGRTPDEIAGQPIVEIMGEEGFRTISPHIKKVLTGQTVEYEAEVSFRGLGAPCLHSVYTPDRDVNGNVIGWFASISDITQRKRVEQRLTEQARLLDLSNDAIIVRDTNDRVTYWNKGAEKIYGYSQKEAIGKVAPDLLKTEHLEPLSKIYEMLSRDNRWEGELVHTRRNGKRLIVFSRWSLDRDTQGQRAYILETNNDISQRKDAEAALKKSKELLEKRVQSRTAELREANQELNSEINRRKGLEGQILEVSDREQERLGQELHDGLCQQLTAIGFLARATALRLRDHRVVQQDDLEKIAQLINSSVMDARNIARGLHKEDIDAAQFLSALQEMVERQIWQTSCRLDLKTKVVIEDDAVASQLYRILREAIINANKHARATRIVLEVRRSGNDLIFSVTDDGVGLSKTKNHGLGFHIMKYRAESIGARLKLESLKKGGARVSCYMPMSLLK